MRWGVYTSVEARGQFSGVGSSTGIQRLSLYCGAFPASPSVTRPFYWP